MPSTRQRVLALLRQQPDLARSEIADRLGVTRQRVAQILDSEQIKAAPGRRGRRPRSAKAVTETAPAIPNAVPAYLAGARGAAGVLVAAADLITRGFSVYLPVTALAGADIVAIDQAGRVQRVNVQRAKRRSSGSLEYEYPKPEDVDVRALLLTDEPVTYEPDLR